MHFFANQSKSHGYRMVVMHTANWLYNWQILELNKQSPNEVTSNRKYKHLFLISAYEINVGGLVPI